MYNSGKFSLVQNENSSGGFSTKITFAEKPPEEIFMPLAILTTPLCVGSQLLQFHFCCGGLDSEHHEILHYVNFLLYGISSSINWHSLFS